MATFWRNACRFRTATKRSVAFKEFRRWILSDAYRCEDAWEKRLTSPIVNQASFSDLSAQIFDDFEATKKSSIIDFEILTAKMHEMKKNELAFTELLLEKFHQTRDAFPVRESIVHGVVRSYLQLGHGERLLELLSKRLKYGLFPDFYTTNFIMDYFIRKGQYREASVMATEMMLQEDVNHPITYLLSLYSCAKSYKEFLIELETSQSEEEPSETVEEQDTEEKKVIVKIYPRPYYDDHFDITSEKFLYGKTLYFIGKHTDGAVGRSLQLVGLGLYEKFPKAIDLLRKWTNNVEEAQKPKELVIQERISGTDDKILMSSAIEDFKQQLENAPTRDPSVGIKEQSIRTVQDEIYQLRITSEEKDHLIKEFEGITSQLQSSEQLSTEDIAKLVEPYVMKEISKYEKQDIDKQLSAFEQWIKEREELLDQQVIDFKRNQRRKEIQRQLLGLIETEELMSFFTKPENYKNALKRFMKSGSLKKKKVRELSDLEKEEIEEQKLQLQKQKKKKL